MLSRSNCVHKVIPSIEDVTPTSNVFHVVDLRPADVDEVLAVGLQWSRLKVVYFLNAMILIEASISEADCQWQDNLSLKATLFLKPMATIYVVRV